MADFMTRPMSLAEVAPVSAMASRIACPTSSAAAARVPVVVPAAAAAVARPSLAPLRHRTARWARHRAAAGPAPAAAAGCNSYPARLRAEERRPGVEQETC